MKHKLTPIQKKTAFLLSEFKKQNIEESRENYLIFEESMQKFIFKSKVSPTAKLLLIYFLSKVDYSYSHLYIHLPYKQIFQETGLQRAVVMRILKKLDEDKFIKFLSGKHKLINTQIKEFIFKQEQNFDLTKNHNQTNLVDMTAFFVKYFKEEA